MLKKITLIKKDITSKSISFPLEFEELLLQLEKEKIVKITPGFFNQYDLSENLELKDKIKFLEYLEKFTPNEVLTKNLLFILKEHFIIKNYNIINLKRIKSKLESFQLTEEKIEDKAEEKPKQKQLSEKPINNSKPEIKKQCCCGAIINYKPRNLNSIPKRPKTQCSRCKKWIYFNRLDVITFASQMIKFDLTNSDQLMTKTDQNQFGSEELVRKSANTKVATDKTRVENISSYDQIQKNDQLMTNSDQNRFGSEELVRKSANSGFIHIKKFSIHKIRFKQDLISKPSWLFGIGSDQKKNDLFVHKVEMHNWNKFILYVNDYDRYGGLHNIEVCNHVIIYNFRHKRKDCIVNNENEMNQFFKQIQNNCQTAREYLVSLGFEINSATPEEYQKPHFVIEGEGDGLAEIEGLYHIGKYCEVKSQNGKNDTMIDASKGDPETESTDKTGVQATLNLAKNIDQISKNVEELKKTIPGMISEIVSKSIGLITTEITKQISETIGNSVANAIKNTFAEPNQEASSKSRTLQDLGGAYI